MAHTDRGWINYTPSDTVRYGSVVSIKADEKTATNNGLTLAVTPSTYDFWPGHRADMRAVYGMDDEGYTDLCIACAPAGTLYNLGATFSDIEDNVYTVNSLRAEKFRIRNLK